MVRSGLALAVLLAVAPPAHAEEPASVHSAPVPSVRPARPGERGLFLLRDGRTFYGVLVSADADGDVIELSSGARIRFAPGDVLGTTEGPAAEERAARPEAPVRPGVVRVFLRDGRTVEGHLVGRTEEEVRIQTAGGEILAFGAAEVREILALDALRQDRGGPLDPARGRHVGVPSAFALGHGEYSAGASGAELPWVAAGLADWLTLTAGTTMPLYHGHTAPFGGSLTAAGNLRVSSWLAASGGLRTFASGDGVTGVLFASVTAGTPAMYATLYAGPPLPASGRLGDFPATVLALAATTRLLSNVAVVGEGWVAPRASRSAALGALAVRFLGRRIAGDVGAMASSNGSIAPWFALTWTDAWGRP